jgi:hypothetical protein
MNHMEDFMAFPGRNYAPPGVYTRTLFENPLAGTLANLKIPVFIGEGNEILSQRDLEIVRGSSASVDQRIVGEDATGRAVASINATGAVTLGSFDGVLTRLQVRNFPIVSGDGTGTATTNRSDVSVTINGQPVLVTSVDGAAGIVTLAQAPEPTDLVRCTYFFNRTDTLITDDVSNQVTVEAAILRGASGLNDANGTAGGTDVLSLHGDILGPNGEVATPANNVLVLTVNEVDRTIVIPPKANYTMVQVANAINAAGVSALTASSFINQYGHSALQLVADNDLVVGSGAANTLLGLVAGQGSNRRRTFFTFQGPIVDGSNGGVTTTDPAAVTVKVNGVQVIPTAVDGASRAVTLPVAPKAGARVTVQYYFNSWQDTFDYLAHVGVTDVVNCGDVPGGQGYIEKADFVLKDDRIYWGSAALVSAGVSTSGSELFDDSQASPMLVDNRTYMSPATPVVSAGGGVASTSNKDFQLAFAPTLGNGRDTPLGQSLFQSVANSRIGLPVNRPDVVTCYWGYDPQDALDRGPVAVEKVEGTVVTLAAAVPVGATVYASHYYNRLTDNEYTLTVVNPGPSGVGTYTVQDSGGNSVMSTTFDIGSKSGGLNGIEITFPSGSELTPDLRIESGVPVEEIVTVQFAARDATPGKWTLPGAGPYEFINGQSDRARIAVDGTDCPSAAGLDLSNPTTWGGGFFASLVSDELAYADGVQHVLAADEELIITFDGVEVPLTVAAGSRTALSYAASINEAASGLLGTFVGGHGAAAASALLDASMPGFGIDDYYVGWMLVSANGNGMITAGEAREITAYNSSTGEATLASAFTITGNASADMTVGAVLAGDTVVIGPDTFLAIAPGVPNAFEFVVDAAPATTAANLRAAIVANGDASYSSAAPVGAVITLTATAAGVGGEAIALTCAAGTVTFADPEGNVATSLKLSLVGDAYRLYNPATVPVMKSETWFNGAYLITAGGPDDFNKVAFAFVGSTNGAYTSQICTIPDGTYATPAALATALQTALNGANGWGNAGAGFAGAEFMVVADGDGRLSVSLQLPGTDLSGYWAFVSTASNGAIPAISQFCTMAGFDLAPAIGGGQTHQVVGPVARAYRPANATDSRHDRIVLRSRMLPGGASMAADGFEAQMGLVVGGGAGNANSGFSTGDSGEGGAAATVSPASMVGRVGFAGGQDANGQPLVTFFNGAGAAPANNVMSFSIDGVPVEVTFTANANGSATATPLGPATTGGTVLAQIRLALTSLPGDPLSLGGSAAAVVLQEGAGMRLVSTRVDAKSNISILGGSALPLLGFDEGEVAIRSLVSTKRLASALMGHRTNASFAAFMTNFTTGAGGFAAANHFAGLGLAAVMKDQANSEYLFLQSVPNDTLNFGSGSSVEVRDASTASWLAMSTGLLATSGQGQSGEAALDGFFVDSNKADGSGSADTSVLNATGQDGVVGQTYRDAVTGLTFTILPRGFHDAPTGPWLSYPAGETFRINVGKTFTADANIPHGAINGVELRVSNTTNIATGDTAILETFGRGGNEPGIGDLYYASYEYTKQDFATSFYTKLSAVERAFGAIDPSNPATLASYLAMKNGAVLVGVKQVQRAEGSPFASLGTYRAAIEELEGVLPGHVKPDMIIPLKGDSLQLFQVLAKSNDIQSSIRYRSERTSIVGLSAGTNPDDAKAIARTLQNQRMRVVYPEIAVMQLTDNLGNTKEHLIDGPMLAAMLAGSVVSPNVDVATPWTGRNLVGVSQLGRILDAVKQNQLAQAGLTVLEDRPPFVRVRHGLTTDVTNILTKTPTIMLIADDVQQQARQLLEGFVGIKFLPGVLSQIEGQLAMLLKGMVASQIITAYTGIKAKTSPDDPTVAEIEAFYQPVFPLLYLVLTFHLRSSL